MKLTEFDYKLPNELIARFPTEKRTESRLLCLDASQNKIDHKHFYDLIDFLNPNDLLVFNDTRVIPARMFGEKASGGKLEVMIERVLNETDVLAHVRCSRSPKSGSQIILDGGVHVEMLERQGDLFHLRFHIDKPLMDVLSDIGHMPLPPYIDRDDEDFDKTRYQTVYAENDGSVAAPTAGLHFDNELLERIKAKGIDSAFLTLHVGAGTFQPVKVDDIREHHMHSEIISVSDEVVEKVKATKAKGGRVIAVGTTSVRSLESASQSGEIKSYVGETDIFIYPGYEFKCVDAIITNFHLPKSSLIMLVSAFAGRDTIMQAYAEAIEKEYRFFSYGDAMFLTHSSLRGTK